MTMTRDTARPDTGAARRAMIDSQLRTSGVNEAFALSRMMAVPREDFLPADKSGLAYIDRSVPLGEGAHLAAPVFYGKLLIEAAPEASDRVLVVEGGTGYLAALIAPLVSEVVRVPAGEAAAGKVPATGSGTGRDGGFSLIVIDGAIEALPDALAASLEEGGRIVSGLVLREVTRLASGRKVSGNVALLPVEDLGIPRLHAFDRPRGWSFS